MTSLKQQVRAQVAALCDHAASSSHDAARMIAALRTAATQLRACATLRSELQATTGLSAPMIDWALTTTLDSLLNTPLETLVATLPPQPVPGELIGVILAGNVFSAALRGLCLPLLAGAHVIAKAKHGDASFAQALQRALTAADSGMGARLAVLEFARDDDAATRALCERVSALSVYGDDRTIAALAGCAPAHSRFVAHGHGISAAYVSEQALRSPSAARQAAEQLALDVAAYDQRGCLSPQFVCVASGAPVSARAFAELLADHALPQQLPAGPPDVEQLGARLQWQAAAAVRGELYSHPSHAVSFEAELPARPSPGGRLIAVQASKDLAALRAQLAPFSQHLKCVGVAGTKAEHAAVTTLLASFSSASACELGTMQTPAFDAWADGQPPFAGLTPR